MAEQRAKQRVPVSLEGTYQSGAVSCLVSIVNISHQGVCFTSSMAPEQNIEIPLNIKLGEAEEVTLHLTVVWLSQQKKKDGTSEYLVGACISGGDKEENGRFISFCDQNNPKVAKK